MVACIVFLEVLQCRYLLPLTPLFFTALQVLFHFTFSLSMHPFDNRVHMNLTPQMVRACETVLSDRQNKKVGGSDHEVTKADMEFLVRRSGFCPTHDRFDELSDIAVKKCAEGPLTTAEFWEICDVLAGEGRWYGECAQGELDEVTCMLLEGIDGTDITKDQLRDLLCGNDANNDEKSGGRLSSEEYEVFWAVVDKHNKGIVKVATIPDCIRASTANTPLMAGGGDGGAHNVEYSKSERDAPVADEGKTTAVTTTPSSDEKPKDAASSSSSKTSSAKQFDNNMLHVDDTHYHALLSPNHERNRPPPIELPSSTTRPRRPLQDPPVQSAPKKDAAKKEKGGGCCLVM